MSGLHKKMICLVLGIILLLSAFTISFAQDEQPTIQPSQTPIVQPSQTPSQTPTVQPSQTQPTASETASTPPIKTPEVLPQQTVLPTQAPTPAPTQTPEASPMVLQNGNAANELITAPKVELNFQVTGKINVANDVDFFRFEVDTERTIEFSKQTTGNITLELLMSDGKPFANEGTHLLQAGTYYVKISGDEAAEYVVKAVAAMVDSIDLSEYNMATGMLAFGAPYRYQTRNGIRTGGNVYASICNLSRGDGPVLEQDSRYILPYGEDGVLDYFDGFVYNKQNTAYGLKQAVLLPERRNALDNEIYKNAISQWGALMVGIRENTDYYAGAAQTYYYHPTEIAQGTGHAVCLIGWDDTVSKELFRITAQNGESYTPPMDGAFLAKNSYTTARGENGYFYISYASMDLSNNPAAAFFVEEPQNEEIYQYDYLGNTSYFVDDSASLGYTNKSIYQKNVFTAQKNGELTAVSFFLTQDQTDYIISVKVNGVQKVVKEGSLQYAGYYKESILPVPLVQGQVFEVIVNFANTTGKPIDAAVETPKASISANTGAQAGQSYFSTDGISWRDISAEDGTLNCVKAFQNGQVDTVKKVKNNLVLRQLPQKFDLRAEGVVTSVKNQGTVPTCWSFASCAAIESMLLRGTKAEFAYIEQSVQTSIGTITMSAPPDAVPMGAALQVSVITNETNPSAYQKAKEALCTTDENFILLDISLIQAQVQVQPTGKLTFRIPIPSGYAVPKMYTITADGKLSELKITIKDGFLEFEVEHLSYFILSNHVSPKPTASVQPTSAPTAPPTPTPTDRPVAPKTSDTSNVTLYGLLVLLCSAVIGMVYKRKKRI
ncbi:MAG: lectin like domain-containing protein [Christensenellaceae bacterium]